MSGWIVWLLVNALQIAPAVNEHQAALAQYRSGAYAAAIAGFRKALEGEKPGTPEYLESNLLLGQSLYLSGQFAEAVPFLEKTSRGSEVLLMLGNSYLKARDLKKAEGAFGELYGLKAGSAAVYLITGQMMLRQQLEDEAEKELLRALELDPKLPQVRYMLGEIATFRGAADRAIEYLREEIALNPNFALAYYKLGDAYTRKSEWPLAIAFLQKSIWLNPDFSGPYILLGKSLLKIDQAANAEGVLRHAVRLDPRNYSAHYLLGQALIQQGKAEEGRKMLEESQTLKQ